MLLRSGVVCVSQEVGCPPSPICEIAPSSVFHDGDITHIRALNVAIPYLDRFRHGAILSSLLCIPQHSMRQVQLCLSSADEEATARRMAAVWIESLGKQRG